MKKFLMPILILVLVLPATWFLWGRGYFYMHDDLQVMRVFEMGKCFADGQIPCRWSPDMAYGYGQAMFNFYSAFPYYLGAFIRLATPLSILATVKTLFLISLVGGAIGMYLLAKEFWGRAGGVLSAVAYTYAPYHALDIFVRGALAEAFALAILPFLWLFLYRVIIKPRFKTASLVAISLACLLATHNISSMIYAPFSLLWALYWLLRNKSIKSFLYVVIAGVLGVGLAGFFIIPAVVEQNLIQTEHLTSGYSDYHAHFVTLTQLFLKRSWGFGPSIFGPNDDLSFQVGWSHWWLILLVGLLSVKWFRAAKMRNTAILAASMAALFLFTAFLSHSKSLVIWENLPLIAFVQFPWRFLGPAIFFLSFALGSIAVPKFFLRKPAILVLILVIVGLNLPYFRPLYFTRKITDTDKLTGEAYVLQQKAAIADYLPKTAEIAPPGPASEKPTFISGDGDIDNYASASNRFSFDAQIFEDAKVAIPVMYFPNWVVLVDNQPAEISINGAHGVISVDLARGRHIVRGRFADTPIRMVANLVTLVSVVVLFSGLVITEPKKTSDVSPWDELGSDMSSSFRGNPNRKIGEDVIEENKKQ